MGKQNQCFPLLFVLYFAISIVAANKIFRFPLIPKSTIQRRTRNLNLDEDGIDLLYQGFGTHYVDLWVGCPSQRQTVIVDTGSSISGFPCSGCSDCGKNGYHISELYQEDRSSCYQKIPCGSCNLTDQCDYDGISCPLSTSYMEGSSWSGFESQDMVYAGGNSLQTTDEETFALRFACKTQITGLFKTQLADGIMGLNKNSGAFWQQMYAADKIGSKQFSLCYRLEQQTQRDAGILVFGGKDMRMHDTPMAYAKDVADVNSSYFFLQLKKVYLRVDGGESIVSNNDQANVVELNVTQSFSALVDSGTTITYLSSQLSRSLEDAWARASSFTYGSSLSLTEEEYLSLPTIIFQFEGSNLQDNLSPPAFTNALDPSNKKDILVAFPPSRYLNRESTGIYSFDIDSDGTTYSILGANFIAGHDVNFDIDNNRVGFAESHCEYNQEEKPAQTATTRPSDKPTTTESKYKEEKPAQTATISDKSTTTESEYKQEEKPAQTATTSGKSTTKEKSSSLVFLFFMFATFMMTV